MNEGPVRARTGPSSSAGGSRPDAHLATRPGADVLYTSCADGPGSPRGFSLRSGFTDTGRVMRGENVLALGLGRGATGRS